MSQPQPNQGGIVDPLDLLDFSEYDGVAYQSPSPSTSSKSQFAPGASASMSVTPPTTLPSSQPMSGPSHQYDQYKQQTPFVPGALASTIAVNQSNADITGYTLEYMSPAEDLFDFNSNPSQAAGTADMEVDFESSENSFYFGDSTINPNAIGTSQTMAAPQSSVGRMYPGMHQQAALAKAQAQQRQQQQIIQQQQQQRQNAPAKQQRSKAPMPADPIVEQKITQLLNSMRSKAGASDDDEPSIHMTRPKKDEDDMDEDERLLASEEGKKLSSKERRQLRNKVSARAFRSRRKEYITQLESEIATKVTENGELRAQNRALMEENRRLSDLTRMLLSSSSFSNFLDHLGTNPAAVPQPQPQQQAAMVEQRQPETQQVPKDVNPYIAASAQQAQPHQIGMAMIPESSMGFSMLTADNSGSYSYQPQVFTVLETPSVPELDIAVLSEKPTHVSKDHGLFAEVKTMAPEIEAPVPTVLAKPEAPAAVVTPERPLGNLDGDIYDDEVDENVSAALVSSLSFPTVRSAKEHQHYELVNASTEEADADFALRRIEKLSASLEASMARLDMLTLGL
ncbi:uncharacterized protein B0I36DRAFT_357579 [Microdochium trichocladiopsis]|uniref:BZIP domain-containing protein n=1 Tax=Microdochium trichocladiopsis TaxID=1682393 RepID=A0A9P8YED4_9PEZI|nr:uncharacterized protein B0I36DRAFT_357579 [Microdochium trichocladiopsis]KAH7040247.1 hypothetical protein B0I36DRAFT_357579 [Microdochium trichocladiopsis]